jgi:hypothetical protein
MRASSPVCTSQLRQAAMDTTKVARQKQRCSSRYTCGRLAGGTRLLMAWKGPDLVLVTCGSVACSSALTGWLAGLLAVALPILAPIQLAAQDRGPAAAAAAKLACSALLRRQDAGASACCYAAGWPGSMRHARTHVCEQGLVAPALNLGGADHEDLAVVGAGPKQVQRQRPEHQLLGARVAPGAARGAGKGAGGSRGGSRPGVLVAVPSTYNIPQLLLEAACCRLAAACSRHGGMHAWRPC